MKKFVFLLAVLSCHLTAQAQEAGVVTYERSQSWVKIFSRMTFLSQEEKDRMKLTWGSREDWKVKMKLYFSPEQSLYTYESDQATSDDGRYSWRQDEFVIQRNFDKEKKLEIMEMLGRTYVIDDSLRTPRWKVTNKIKEVAGHICMSAETTDSLKNQKITAWFAQDIPVQAGPEQYFGLPGLILELDINDGDALITATKVEFKPIDKEMPKPKAKGKKISDKEYKKLIADHIADSIKAQRNPYWAIRY
ncbi:hypothetical protein GCM10023189_00210 [Nibrella saemangeumensis]|uniref:GLPGLI family protein n=1 Tax=Nibrella saemangeumensis TaxID=1084526 RepID=A0ABP8M7C7_9BACT